MFVFLQVLKLVMETTVKVKYFLRMEVSTTPVSYISLSFFVILQENVFSEFCIYRLAQSFYVVLVKNCLLYLAHKRIRQTTLLPNLKNLYFTFLRILLCIINCHLSSCLMVREFIFCFSSTFTELKFSILSYFTLLK
jgi:hypothetical protein